MAKTKKVYICSQCGYEALRWQGQCPECHEWNTLNEEIISSVQQSTKSVVRSSIQSGTAKLLSEISEQDEIRYHTGLSELDRVLGGGIVAGSVVLLGGDPGIGKSTILLQICQYLGEKYKILYVSGEESGRQLKLRATRLGVNTESLSVLCEIDVEVVIETVRAQKPDLVMIDSIQTMTLSELNSSAGSVTQVRECTTAFLRCAKSFDIPFLIVGHVNKDGAIAGPKVLEHIVDAVLYFEGERNLTYRILRAVKNRFGSTNEIGVFEMQDRGLSQVENPSKTLLSGRPKGVAGSCVACIMEGSRPLLAEVQGLVSQSAFGNPRRMSVGFDYNRINMILAVLEKRAGYFFSTFDTYTNVIGGLRLDEPAADLTIALALVSSLKDIPVDETTISFGEIGLSGEIRSVGNAASRVSEAIRLGFTRCVIPYHNLKSIENVKLPPNVDIIGVRNVREAVEVCLRT